MKKTFIRILSLILVFATLMPAMVACKTPENNGEGGEGGENGGGEGGGGNGDVGYQPPANLVHANQIGEDVIKIVDFQNDVIEYGKLTNPLTQKDGNTVFTCELKAGESIAFGFPEEVNIGHHYFIEFTVYSDAEGSTEFDLRLPTCEAPVRIKLDFEGKRHYKIKQDAFSVKNPYRTITGLQINNITGSGRVYISNIVATNPKYELYVPEGVDLNDLSIYEPLLDNYRSTLVGPSEKQTNELYVAKYKKYKNNATNCWNLFKETKCEINEPEKLFNVLVYNQPEAGYGTPAVCGSNISKYYEYIRNMALGYAAPGCDGLYKNKQLLEDILFALEYGYLHYYGVSILNDGITHGNWYPWDASIPNYLLETLVLIENDIDRHLVLKYKSPFDAILPYPLGSASNLLVMARNVILSAALGGEAMRLAVVNELIQETFVYVDELPPDAPYSMNDGGFYSDGSFIQHGGVAYLGSYGVAHFSALALLMTVTSGSVFEIHGENVDNQYELIFTAIRPLLYDDSLMAMVSGRNLGGRVMERQTFRSMLMLIIAMRSYAPDKYKEQLDPLIKSLMLVCEENSLEWKTEVGIAYIEDALEIRSNESLKTETPTDYNVTKVLGAMDRVVHHGPKYGVGISMSSTRIYKYESINEANEIGWYHGDGMIYIYTDGIDFGFHYFFYANPYLMPGTTVNLSERLANCLHPMIYNSNPYAGGVAQGKYGSAGFILGYPTSALNSNTFKNKTDENLVKITAKKSYFMFDDEVICVGSGINDWSGAEVVTVVDNRIWGIREATAVTDSLYINGELISSPATVQTEIFARTMYFTNMGGYVFLRADANGKDRDGNKLYYKKATNKVQPAIDASQADPESTMSFLEITLNHGKGDGKLSGDKYFYAYLPESTVQETEDYYTNPDVQLLKRTSDIHAVLEKTLGIVACNFFASGTKDTVNVNDASTQVKSVSAQTLCALMIGKNENGETVISASDPTQNYKSITFSVTLDHAPSVVSADDRVNATVEGNTVKITINTVNSYGATFNLKVK